MRFNWARALLSYLETQAELIPGNCWFHKTWNKNCTFCSMSLFWFCLETLFSVIWLMKSETWKLAGKLVIFTGFCPGQWDSAMIWHWFPWIDLCSVFINGCYNVSAESLSFSFLHHTCCFFHSQVTEIKRIEEPGKRSARILVWLGVGTGSPRRKGGQQSLANRIWQGKQNAWDLARHGILLNLQGAGRRSSLLWKGHPCWKVLLRRWMNVQIYTVIHSFPTNEDLFEKVFLFGRYRSDFLTNS